MKRNFRLTQARDFTRIKNDGKSKHHQLIVLACVPNDLNYSRMACVASKSVGNAVMRNLVKRRMRACVANLWNDIKTGWDLVFYARSASALASYDEMHQAVADLLHSTNLLKM